MKCGGQGRTLDGTQIGVTGLSLQGEKGTETRVEQQDWRVLVPPISSWDWESKHPSLGRARLNFWFPSWLASCQAVLLSSAQKRWVYLDYSSSPEVSDSHRICSLELCSQPTGLSQMLLKASLELRSPGALPALPESPSPGGEESRSAPGC